MSDLLRSISMIYKAISLSVVLNYLKMNTPSIKTLLLINKYVEKSVYLIHKGHHACVHAKLLQSCLTPCDPVDCNSPSSSVHGTLQARILQWVAMPSSRESSWSRDQTCISCIGRKVLYYHCHLGSSCFWMLPQNYLACALDIINLLKFITVTLSHCLHYSCCLKRPLILL